MPKEEMSTALVGFTPMTPTAQGRKEMGEFFSSADLKAWNAVPPSQKIAFANVALAYGLHPLGGEIMVYKDKLYITIEGRRRLAMRQPDFAAVQPDVVTDPVIRKAMGARWAGDILARCVMYRKSTPVPTIQYGLLREAERYPSEREREQLGVTTAVVNQARQNHDPDAIMDAATNPEAKVRPVITQPAIMAMKRAEARCLNIIAQAPLPTFDTEADAPLDDGAPNGDADVIESTARELSEEPEPPEQPVEGAGGPAAAPASESPQAAPGPTAVGATSNPRPPAPMAEEARGRGGLLNPPDSAAKLLRFAVEKLGYKNIASVLNALSVDSAEAIADPAAAWNILCDLQGK